MLENTKRKHEINTITLWNSFLNQNTLNAPRTVIVITMEITSIDFNSLHLEANV